MRISDVSPPINTVRDWKNLPEIDIPEVTAKGEGKIYSIEDIGFFAVNDKMLPSVISIIEGESKLLRLPMELIDWILLTIRMAFSKHSSSVINNVEFGKINGKPYAESLEYR